MLVQAFHEGAPRHREYRAWLSSAVALDEPFGLSELVLSGFIRVATHPRVFDPPAPIGEALAFAEALRSQPNAVAVSPGPRHWEILERLCRAVEARGNLVPDAYLAALAIESGSEWITADRDFSRFPGLRWRHPLAEGQHVDDVLAVLGPLLPDVDISVEIRDPDDAAVVGAALAGAAAAITTGDRDLLDDARLRSWLATRGIEVLTPAQTLDRLARAAGRE